MLYANAIVLHQLNGHLIQRFSTTSSPQFSSESRSFFLYIRPTLLRRPIIRYYEQTVHNKRSNSMERAHSPYKSVVRTQSDFFTGSLRQLMDKFHFPAEIPNGFPIRIVKVFSPGARSELVYSTNEQKFSPVQLFFFFFLLDVFGNARVEEVPFRCSRTA